MKPTVAIGDIHGSTYWKEIVDENPDCQYVFLGDYLDPYQHMEDEDLARNFQHIMDFKKAKPDEVILLLGNHDLHYVTEDIPQSMRFNYAIADYIEDVFQENRNLFQYAYQEDNYIFVHAGISQRWFLDDFHGTLDENIATQLNNPRPDQRSALFQCGRTRGGECSVGGIFWADRRELVDPLQGYTQIVGHNRVPNITEYSEGSGKIIFCDSMLNHNYLRL